MYFIYSVIDIPLILQKNFGLCDYDCFMVKTIFYYDCDNSSRFIDSIDKYIR